jgi:hypothetical protein
MLSPRATGREVGEKAVRNISILSPRRRVHVWETASTPSIMGRWTTRTYEIREVSNDFFDESEG